MFRLETLHHDSTKMRVTFFWFASALKIHVVECGDSDTFKRLALFEQMKGNVRSLENTVDSS